jgi:cytochrome b561
MRSPDTPKHYDWFSILLHWSVAFITVALFVSGLWMVDLDYYHEWYYRAPWWHKSMGVLVVTLVLIRLVWSRWRSLPAQIGTIPHRQHLAAKFVHGLMNLCIVLLGLTGYLMVTAKGEPLEVFDWFQLPALVAGKAGWVDTAGVLHLWIAYVTIALAAGHALAALKHHFIDQDATLMRMLGFNKGDNP